MATADGQRNADSWTYPHDFPKDGTQAQRLDWATSAIAALEWHKVTDGNTGPTSVPLQMDDLSAQAAAAAADIAKNFPGLVQKAKDGQLSDAYDFVDEISALSVIAAQWTDRPILRRVGVLGLFADPLRRFGIPTSRTSSRTLTGTSPLGPPGSWSRVGLR